MMPQLTKSVATLALIFASLTAQASDGYTPVALYCENGNKQTFLADFQTKETFYMSVFDVKADPPGRIKFVDVKPALLESYPPKREVIVTMTSGHKLTALITKGKATDENGTIYEQGNSGTLTGPSNGTELASFHKCFLQYK